MNAIFSGLIIISVVIFFCMVFKINSKILVGISLLFIAFSALLLLADDIDFANDMANVGYFLLMASVALIVLENIRDRKKTDIIKNKDEG